ncbi:efflux RND transporter periplasmic adaptor subunit [Falsiruegeria mediterranea]|jgi:membrane fusion protein, multidrug efflux system|uniref:Multidrug efflux pump subunit AcrA n=1 Tax=Falsiruegeria mediterranea M17 TaxID=1200281 RepID=A0A2R8C5U3_9RHOB|nr:HlyD family efflux transporter periplasmic adaptor subunit [Falsiruegeria mediterranea]SPJ27797.1 Multidrug efflux pump subunit AcrA [Falsiruegeria mediterranea M17]
MRFLRQSLVGVFLASMTLALLLYAGQLVMGAVQSRLENEKKPPQARERVFAVNVQRAEFGTVVPELEAFGQVQSRRTLELRAAAAGRVVELAENVEEGGVVHAGEVLIRIDPADAQSALDRAESDLLDAQAEERDAERTLDLARNELQAAIDQSELRDRALKRQQDLAERGVGTAAAVETAELAAASARQAVLARRISEAQAEARVDQTVTRLARAQIALDAAQRDLTDTTIKARFDGTLSEVHLVEGRLVSANEKLAELVDPMALEVAFRVSTAQYARLLNDDGRLINATVIASLDAAGSNLLARGTISRDSAAAGEGQSGRLIFARLEAALGFKPGDFVTVSVEEPPLDGVARLPASSYAADRTVLVVGADDRLETLKVQLVRRQGDHVLLRGEGLEGREVVVGRTPLLGAGIRVRPLREEAEAAPVDPMVELTDERRAKLVAFVEGNQRMPDEMKERVLARLAEVKVPAALVQRIEARMGG